MEKNSKLGLLKENCCNFLLILELDFILKENSYGMVEPGALD